MALLLRHRLRLSRRTHRAGSIGGRHPDLHRRGQPRVRIPGRLIEATGLAKDALCRACFDGEYPVALADPKLRSKHLLEVAGS